MRQVLQLEDPDPRGGAAAVILPLAEPLAEGGIGQGLASGEIAPMSPLGIGRARGTPPSIADREELRMPST